MKLIDAHVHLWDPSAISYPWLSGHRDLNRPFLAVDAAGLGDRGLVLVEANAAGEDGLREAHWMHTLSRELPVRAVVAAAPLEDRIRLEQRLEALSLLPLVKGVRRIVQDEPSEFVRSRDFVGGLRRVTEAGMSFDACVRDSQLPDIAWLAREVPGARIALDHLGKPSVTESGPDRTWSDALRACAQHPLVWVKLSGLLAEAPDAPDAVFTPYLDIAFGAFGSQRCMFGSDWPASSATEPRRWERIVGEWLVRRPDIDAAAVLGGSAAEFYQLERDAGSPGRIP